LTNRGQAFALLQQPITGYSKPRIGREGGRWLADFNRLYIQYRDFVISFKGIVNLIVQLLSHILRR
jgi:hypothetical protein